MNFNNDYLSQCVGTVHSLLLNFQQGSKLNSQFARKSNLLKENEDYIHIGVKEPKINLGKTLSEKVVDTNNPFSSARTSNIMRLKRLDSVMLDTNGKR
jgi:hypothetical protein